MSKMLALMGWWLGCLGAALLIAAAGITPSSAFGDGGNSVLVVCVKAKCTACTATLVECAGSCNVKTDPTNCADCVCPFDQWPNCHCVLGP